MRCKVTKTVSEKQLLKPEAKDSPTLYESPPGFEILADVEVLLYVHRNRRLIRDGSPKQPPRLSHSSWALEKFLLSTQRYLAWTFLPDWCAYQNYWACIYGWDLLLSNVHRPLDVVSRLYQCAGERNCFIVQTSSRQVKLKTSTGLQLFISIPQSKEEKKKKKKKKKNPHL